MCISGVGSFPVQSGGFSNIFSSSLGERKLALNRVFSYFLLVGICLYTPLCVCMPPYICMPPYVHTPPICLYSPLGVYTPQGPPMFLCSCMVIGTLHVVGGCFLFYVYWDTPPLFGVPPPLLCPPTLHCWFSVHCYSQGYQFLFGPFSPSIEGFGGVPPSLGEVGVTHQ